MKQCLIKNCKALFGCDRSNLTFYHFPANKEDCTKWLVKCGLDETYDCSQSVICSRHFDENDFLFDLNSRLIDQTLKKNLKKGAVPHLNLCEIKQEPLDADEVEYDERLNPPNTRFDQFYSVETCKHVDTSLFEGTTIKENHSNADLVPVEPINNAINIPPLQNSVSSSNAAYIPSSLPASHNWSGPHDFDVLFEPQEKNTKSVSWTYSNVKDKLYVGKDAPCPINFSAKNIMSDNVIIRATALFRSPEHASEVVHRCVNHSTSESSKGVFEADHLIRCESQMAYYETHPTTKRHSVIVPFENPPEGQQYSTYIYKFTCFGSCAGGPNRRPLMLIFSLEKEGKVIGQRKLDVKICACPGRDKQTEEKQLQIKESPEVPLKRKGKEMVSLSETLEFTKTVYLPPVKKVKTTSGAPYTLSVTDRDCYDFLKHMKKFFEMCKTVNNLPPNVKALIHVSRPNNNQEAD